MPYDLPPWETVYQSTRRCLQTGCFEAMAWQQGAYGGRYAGTFADFACDSRRCTRACALYDQEGLCAAAQALDSRAQLWMVGEISPVIEGLETAATGAQWAALSGVYGAHVADGNPDIGDHRALIARSKP